MNKLMKGLVPIVIIVIAYNIFFKTSSNTTTSSANNINKVSSIEAYGSKGTLNNWPSLGDETSIADNLLTKNYYIVFDGSGSMKDSSCEGRGSKIDIAKRAISEFVDNIAPSENIGLLVFDYSGNYERVALSMQNRSQLKQEISNVNASGGTPLSSAISEAYMALTNRAKQQMGYGEYHLVIVTDGEASKGESPNEIVARIVKQSPVQLHTIGFCIDSSHSLNQQDVVNYRSASSAESLIESLKAVLAEAESFDISEFEG